jgi:hypothetical protein
MCVNLGVRYCVLMPEDGENVAAACIVKYNKVVVVS